MPRRLNGPTTTAPDVETLSQAEKRLGLNRFNHASPHGGVPKSEYYARPRSLSEISRRRAKTRRRMDRILARNHRTV